MENMIYWIWLSLACTPGSTTFGKLIKEYKGAKEIYEADGKRIASVIGYRTSDRSSLEDKSLDRAEEIYNFCKKHKVGIVTYADEGFPEALRTINDPPVLLYYIGRLPDLIKFFLLLWWEQDGSPNTEEEMPFVWDMTLRRRVQLSYRVWRPV